MVGMLLVLDQWWILVPLVFGFVARVATGPRFSPLGLLVTRVIRPRLPVAPRSVAGPPKRFAQAMGVTFSVIASVLFLASATAAATVVLVLLLVAASLEAFIGLCLGCKVFAMLMRLGVIPDDVCVECADFGSRLHA